MKCRTPQCDAVAHLSQVILADVSKASTIGRDWHLQLDVGSQIDADVMQPMMERVLGGEDVATCVKDASDKLDEVLGLK